MAPTHATAERLPAVGWLRRASGFLFCCRRAAGIGPLRGREQVGGLSWRPETKLAKDWQGDLDAADGGYKCVGAVDDAGDAGFEGVLVVRVVEHTESSSDSSPGCSCLLLAAVGGARRTRTSQYSAPSRRQPACLP